MDSEGSKDGDSHKNHDNYQEPLRGQCELHTSYEKKEYKEHKGDKE